MKATKVDGIYAKDPAKYKVKRIFKKIKYIDVLKRGLKVMDATAISLCMDNNIPILVFNLQKEGNIRKVITGKDVGTLVSGR